MCCALTSISSLQFGFRTGIFLAVMNIPCDEFSLQQQPQQVQYHPAVLNYAVFILCLLCVVKQDLRQLCPGGGGIPLFCHALVLNCPRIFHGHS